MAENALNVTSRRAADSCMKAGTVLLACALSISFQCGAVRADSAVPDIRLRPSSKAKQELSDTKQSTSRPAKVVKKETAFKSRNETVPNIVLQRVTPRPITVASKAKAKSEGATAGCLESAVADSPSSASDGQHLAVKTPKDNPAKAPSAKQSPTPIIEQTARIIDDSEPAKIHLASPIDATDYTRFRAQNAPRQANYQVEQLPTPAGAENQAAPAGQPQDPCAAIAGRPFHEFGINTAVPDGDLPVDVASGCWVSVNSAAGPFAGQRAWASSIYAWDATCLGYRPLYFEEANLERYGYGCCETMQPLASAAHFFGTIPLLPYCMATDCPNECIYTLGHYRPGSCVPKRYLWPPVTPRAILAEGGVWTGLVFLIP